MPYTAPFWAGYSPADAVEVERAWASADARAAVLEGISAADVALEFGPELEQWGTVVTTTCGSDLHLLGGYVPTTREGDVIGHEYMGEVVEVGPETTRLKAGDRVVLPCFLGCGKCWYREPDERSQCDNTHPKPALCEPPLGYLVKTKEDGCLRAVFAP